MSVQVNKQVMFQEQQAIDLNCFIVLMIHYLDISKLALLMPHSRSFSYIQDCN